MRIVVAPRSRISPATRANSASRSRRRSRASGCSRISSRNRAPGSLVAATCSADDTRAPFDEHSLDLEVVAEDDEIGWKPDAEPAGRREPQNACRHIRGCTDCILERHAERMEVADGVDHRERAPGERTGRTASDAVADLDVE